MNTDINNYNQLLSNKIMIETCDSHPKQNDKNQMKTILMSVRLTVFPIRILTTVHH